MNSSGSQIERLKCRATNCVKNGTGDCICVYGTVGVTGPVEVYGSVGVTGPFTVTGTVGVTGPVTVTGAVDITSASNSDAFGRLRVSNPYTLLEFNQIQDKNSFHIDEEVIGTATSTHTGSYTLMSVSNSGDSVIRQTHEYSLYQPGKSRLVYMTGTLYDNPLASNTITRIGSYGYDGGGGDLMGVYIQQDNGALSVNMADGDGAINSVPRASWTDKLDESGPSGKSIRFDRAQIYTFDFEWLGVGQVRCGVVFEGRILIYYTFTHANTLTAPYTRQAKLPLRYEIISNGGSNSMRMICGTVISEGGATPIGRKFILSNTMDISGFPVMASTTVGTYLPMLAVRLRNSYPYHRCTVKLQTLDLINTTYTANAVNGGSWRIVFRPTISGTPTWTNYDTNNSAIQYTTNFAGITYTGGRVCYNGFYESRAQGIFVTSNDELIAEYPLASNIQGEPDVAIIEVNRLSGNQDVKLYYILKWLEYI